MKNLLQRNFCKVYFYLPDPHAAFLGYGTGSTIFKVMRRTGIWLLKRLPALWAISKEFIVVAIKS